MDANGLKLGSSKGQNIQYVQLEEFVDTAAISSDTNSSDANGGKIPNSKFLHRFSEGAKHIQCTIDEFFSDALSESSKKEFVASMEAAANEAGPFLIGPALIVLFPVGVVVAAGIGLIGVPLITLKEGTYGALLLSDHIYDSCNPESNHGTKWSDQFENLFNQNEKKPVQTPTKTSAIRPD